MRNGLRLHVLGLVAALTLISALGCATRTVETKEQTSIGFAPRNLQKMSISSVYREKKLVGSVEQYREIDGDNNDANDRSFWVVLDADGQRLGYVTDDLRAYRYQAHGNSEMVANHPKLANDIMAVYGWYDGSIEVERQVVKD